MINQDIVAQDLFYKLRGRFPKLEMGDESGTPTFDAKQGRFFDFDAVFEGVNLGTVSVSIKEPGSLKLYFSRNILEDSDSIVSSIWYKFLKEMRKFAMKRLLSFDTRDISKNNLDKRDYGYLASKESNMTESRMYGNKHKSYMNMEGTHPVKIVVRHLPGVTVEDNVPGARRRKINSIFIENHLGERYKMPRNSMRTAEAMARHCANEGNPHDDFGKHINEMCANIAQLESFHRHVKHNMDSMNPNVPNVLEATTAKLLAMKECMGGLSKQRYYEQYKENWEGQHGMSSDSPLMDETALAEYTDMFTKREFKEDLASVFPLIHRIMQEKNELTLESIVGESADDYCDACDRPKADCICDKEETKESISPEAQFESWANTIVETRMSPEEIDTLKGLLGEHFPAGPGGENAKSALSQLGLDDANLFTQIESAGNIDPDSDVRKAVYEFLERQDPELLGALGGETAFGDLAGATQTPVQEGMNPEVGQALYAKFQEMAPNIEQFKDDAGSADLFDALESIARQGGASGEFRQMCNGARNSAHMEFDTNPGDFKNWFPFLGQYLEQFATQGEEGMIRESGDQSPEEKRHAMEYLSKVSRAIKSGEVQPEEVEDEFFNTLPMLGVSDEKVMQAWGRITGAEQRQARPSMSDDEIDAELRGMKGGEDDSDDAFLSKLRGQARGGSIKPDTTDFGAEMDEAQMEQEPEQSGKSKVREIAEMVKSFYNSEDGTFPLGETGVKIKIEKEFGEQAGQLAEKFIQQLSARNQQNDEFSEIQRFNSRLNGINEAKKAKPDFLDMDKDGDKKEPMKKALKDKEVKEGAKPDFLDVDKDGNKKETFKKAVKDKDGKKVPEKKKTIKESADFLDLLVLSGIKK